MTLLPKRYARFGIAWPQDLTTTFTELAMTCVADKLLLDDESCDCRSVHREPPQRRAPRCTGARMSSLLVMVERRHERSALEGLCGKTVTYAQAILGLISLEI
jgi:hypothetical protein